MTEMAELPPGSSGSVVNVAAEVKVGAVLSP
jgi:hypothetical protein